MYFVVAVSQSNWFVAIKGHDLQRKKGFLVATI